MKQDRQFGRLLSFNYAPHPSTTGRNRYPTTILVTQLSFSREITIMVAVVGFSIRRMLGATVGALPDTQTEESIQCSVRCNIGRQL